MAANGGTAETRSDSRSVQDYIDETPAWSDGTPVAQAPMTAMQKRVWCLAAAGKFFEGLVVFTTGSLIAAAAFPAGASANRG